jgi:hypothetical protein
MVADWGSYCRARSRKRAPRRVLVEPDDLEEEFNAVQPPPLWPSLPTPLRILFLGRKRNREKDREGAVGPTCRWTSQICFCVNNECGPYIRF